MKYKVGIEYPISELSNIVEWQQEHKEYDINEDITVVTISKRPQNLINEDLLNDLTSWFDKYDLQIKQYERDKRLGIEGVYHIDGEDYTIDELDEQAIYVANQIKELRNQLQALENLT